MSRILNQPVCSLFEQSDANECVYTTSHSYFSWVISGTSPPCSLFYGALKELLAWRRRHLILCGRSHKVIPVKRLDLFQHGLSVDRQLPWRRLDVWCYPARCQTWEEWMKISPEPWPYYRETRVLLFEPGYYFLCHRHEGVDASLSHFWLPRNSTVTRHYAIVIHLSGKAMGRRGLNEKPARPNYYPVLLVPSEGAGTSSIWIW